MQGPTLFSFHRQSLLAIMLAVGILAPVSAADSKKEVPSKKLPALRVKGTRIVTESGQEIVLRGVNLGSWLSIEPPFTGIQFQDEKSLWAGLARRHGKEAMAKIREAYRTVWITAKDLERVHDLGLNHVRVPFWYGLLEDDARPGKYLESGWKWLDNVVDWSERAGLYCVLDLHGAPGGQSKEEHTGEKDRNALWENPLFRKRTADLWIAIAKRYKGRTCIAAFDLLNEPMGAPSDDALLVMSFTLLRAVRKADPTRLVILEDGYRGLNKFPRTSPQLRGVIYSQHHYPTMKAAASPEAHTRFFDERFPIFARDQLRYQAPLYIGEWSVIQDAAGGGPMTRRHIEEMEKRGWSWCLWLYKQSNRDAVSQCWGVYRNNHKLDLPDMDKDSVEKILAKLDALRTENMVIYEPLHAALADK